MALIAIGLFASAAWNVPFAKAQDSTSIPHWIWFSGDRTNEVGVETRYFRKEFTVAAASRLALDVAADNKFTLFLDGAKLGEGDAWQSAEPVEARLAPGPHVLAAIATNTEPGAAGLLIRGGILPPIAGGPVQTDRSWRSTDRAPEGDAWLKPGFDDGRWPNAADLGAYGTGPWGNGVNFSSGDTSERFKTLPGFQVTMVAPAKVTGSVVSFAFDDLGRPCVGVEGKPIYRLIDADGDGHLDGRQVIAPAMNNCQGFSFIRGKLYAVGDGPQGAGLYRLSDPDGDGVFQDAQAVRLAEGGMGEHGPHAVKLGPDGRLYYNNGNHAHLKPPIDTTSPVNVAYEGELLPHYNDARGHAAGVMAPGGEIYRSDDDGKTWKRISAGYRNHYDFAFNRLGDIFTFDSDMEWDVGLPWYRPVRVNHAQVGSEFGWRNGSGKWPTYFFDSLPSTIDLGRGSPTGVTFYQADLLPKEFDDALLICDWSQGRILAVMLEKAGASYKATAKELVTGQPLNCTDIEVGPDGAVYFTTGGRGTQGGLFRVAPKDAKPGRSTLYYQLGVAWVMNETSPQSAFTHARIAKTKAELADNWSMLLDIPHHKDHSAREKIRMLEIFNEFGPAPSDETLAKVARDKDPDVRCRALAFLGLHRTKVAQSALTLALSDPDPMVRRRACEGLIQQPRAAIPVVKLISLLDDPDRWLRSAARTAIEHGDIEAHRKELLTAHSHRAVLEGVLALARATKLDAASQDTLFHRANDLLTLRKGLRPDEFLDLLRVIGLTYQLGPRKADHAASAGFRQALLGTYPTGDDPTDRELARLLAYLGEPKAIVAILAHQSAKGTSQASQIHDAYCLRALKSGWDAKSKAQIWAWFEAASHWDGGYSFLGYLDFMVQDILADFSAAEIAQVLSDGDRTPFPTRVLVRMLELDREPGRVALLVSLYRRLAKVADSGASNELRNGILETLGKSSRAESRAALREIAGLDPARRDPIARAVADRPTLDDVPTLADALESRDPNTLSPVLAALKRLDAVPPGPGPLRNLLRLARKSGPTFGPDLDILAARWTKTPAPADRDFDARLKYWEGVYRSEFPTAPAIAEESTAAQNSYTLPQLATHVLGDPALMRSASADRGREVLKRARCLDCHKLGDQGAGLGPDLTTVRSRFSPAEILESIVAPSKVISDQYKSKAIATTDGKVFTGMPVVTEGENLVLLLSDGTRVTIRKSEIDATKDSATSVMPEGLLNPLSYRDVADALALFESLPRVEAPNAGKK